MGRGPWDERDELRRSSPHSVFLPSCILHPAWRMETKYLAATLCPPPLALAANASVRGVGVDCKSRCRSQVPRRPRAAWSKKKVHDEKHGRWRPLLWGRIVPVPEPTVPSGVDAGSIKSTWKLTSRPGDPRVHSRVHRLPRLSFFQPDCDCYCPGLWHMDCWPVFPVFCRQARRCPTAPGEPAEPFRESTKPSASITASYAICHPPSAI